MDTTRQAVSPEQGGHAHQEMDVRVKGFILFLVGFVLTGLVIHIILYFLYGVLVRSEPWPAASPVAAQAVPPAPRIQGSAINPRLPREDMRLYREKEDKVLGSYGWADRQANVARIPIDRAMELWLQQQKTQGKP